MRIGIRALRARLTDCVRSAAAGEEEFEIACHGRVLARLTSAHRHSPDGVNGKSDSAKPRAAQTVDGMNRFSVNSSVSSELKQLVQAKLREFEQMSTVDLESAFTQTTNVDIHPYFTDPDLRLALARIFQLKLWIDRIGVVPGDIAAKDLQFWQRLLAQTTREPSEAPPTG